MKLKYWLPGALLAVVFVLLLIYQASAFRIAKPTVFALPWTEPQVNQLNDFLDKIWNVHLGELSMDVVTTSKTNADEGDIWFITTGLTTRLQFKAQNRVWTVDAY